MSVQENKDLVREFYEEVVSTGNVDRVDEFVSQDYAEVLDGTRYAVGIQGAKEHIIGVRETYTDLKIIVERQIAEGDWVATCIVAQGTHEGRWLGIEPTHRAMVWTGASDESERNETLRVCHDGVLPCRVHLPAHRPA